MVHRPGPLIKSFDWSDINCKSSNQLHSPISYVHTLVIAIGIDRNMWLIATVYKTGPRCVPFFLKPQLGMMHHSICKGASAQPWFYPKKKMIHDWWLVSLHHHAWSHTGMINHMLLWDYLKRELCKRYRVRVRVRVAIGSYVRLWGLWLELGMAFGSRVEVQTW